MEAIVQWPLAAALAVARKRAAQRAFRPSRFGLAVFDKRPAFASPFAINIFILPGKCTTVFFSN